MVSLLLSSAGVGLAQTVDATLWITNGLVTSIVRDASTIYIGGNFTRVGPATGGWVAIDASTGAAQQPYPKVLGTVYAVAPDGSGGWYVGGAFTAVRGQPRNNLAHLDAGGNLTAWNPNANSEVDALAVSGGVVYAGGNFTSIGGQPRNHIAALDGSGAATAWDPNSNNIVFALVVSGGTVYAAGYFTSIGGQSRNHVAALNAITGAATTWNPNPDGFWVTALAVSGSTVYAGGDFTSIGGQQRQHIAALDATTGAATTAWIWNADNNVYALAVSGGTVYAGGNFRIIGGQPRDYIAALNATTGAATAWKPIANGVVRALAVGGNHGGTVYAGGDFTSIGGQPRNYIAAVDAVSGTATAWNPNATNVVQALAVSGGTVYAGGFFTFIGGQTRNNIAALDAATRAPTAWNPNANARVQALAVSGGTVYAAGDFTGIGGQPRNRIAALDAASGAATAWNPNAPNPNDHVWALAVSGGTVYVGGSFTSMGGQARNNIAALDAASGAATTWNPNAGGGVYALAVSGDTVYAGGGFTSIGGQARNCIAALDAASGGATAWNPNATNGVYALALSAGTVYAGGTFISIGGQARSCIAALDAASGAVTAWAPDARSNPRQPPVVFALAVSDGTVYAGGFFINIGGQPRIGIAALDAATGGATAWNPHANGDFYALTLSGGTVYAGGTFSNVGGQPQSNFAAISAAESCPSVAMSFDFNPNALNLQSMGHWVTGMLEPEPPDSPSGIDVASILLNGSVPVDASAPTSIGDVDGDGRPDLTVKFDRAAVDLAVTEGNSVPVTVAGNIRSGCFSANDVIRMVRGHVTAPSAGAVDTAGTTTEVRWDTPADVQVQSVAVLSSSDDGSTWNLVAHELPNTGSYLWTVPGTATDLARIAVVLVESANASEYDVTGVLGVSGRFEITPPPGVVVPGVELAIHGSVPNPATSLTVSFSLPDAQPASLVAYDVSGREVSRSAVGIMGAGRHVVTLGTSPTLAPGVYLVHLIRGDRRLVARAVVVR